MTANLQQSIQQLLAGVSGSERAPSPSYTFKWGRKPITLALEPMVIEILIRFVQSCGYGLDRRQTLQILHQMIGEVLQEKVTATTLRLLAIRYLEEQVGKLQSQLVTTRAAFEAASRSPRRATSTAPVPSLHLDTHGVITDANVAAITTCSILGENLGRKIDQVFQFWNASDGRRDAKFMQYICDPQRFFAVSSLARWRNPTNEKECFSLFMIARREKKGTGWEVELSVNVGTHRTHGSAEVILTPGCYDVSVGFIP